MISYLSAKIEPIANLLMRVSRVFVTETSWEGSGEAQLLQKRAVSVLSE